MTEKIPEEVLLHILSFIPTDEMDNVMLVNKSFYAYCSKQLSFQCGLKITKSMVSFQKDLGMLNFKFSSFYSSMIDPLWFQ